MAKSYDLRREVEVAKMQTLIDAVDGLGLADTGAASTVAVSITSVNLLAANAGRKQVVIRNDTNQDLYIAHGATATVSSAIKLKKNDVYLEDKYTGTISGIWGSVAGGGNAQIIEDTKE